MNHVSKPLCSRYVVALHLIGASLSLVVPEGKLAWAQTGTVEASAPVDAYHARADWAVVSDEVMAEERGGIRIGELEVSLTANVSNFLNGQEVSKTTGLDALESIGNLDLPGMSALPDQGVDGATVFQQGITEGGGLAFVLANTANDVDIHRNIDVQVRIDGFREAFGNVADQANGLLASSLAGQLGGL